MRGEWRIPGNLGLYIQDLLMLSCLKVGWRVLRMAGIVSLRARRNKDVNNLDVLYII